MIGTTVSHYRILEKLGEGGMGIVYRAHDTTLDRDVALKFLPHYLTSDPAEKERFYHEARAAASLTHQNIAVVYEIGEHDGQIFIAMEYVEGQSLKQIVAEGLLSTKKVLDLAIQVCEGLQAAHEKGVVHRDIKSDNIMVTPKGQAKITDFGLAKLKGATKLTKAGSTMGTAAYMSPEQARGEEVDQRSDIFSFGVVLYEMLTMHLPFRGDHIAAIQYSVVNEAPPPLARYNETITGELQHIVSKSLEKDAEDRYQHVDEMLADLRRERKHLEYAQTSYVPTPGTPAVETRPPAGPAGQPPRAKRLTKMFAAVGIVALIAAAFLILRPFITGEAISSERRTIAVISFVNQTGDSAYDYLQDAIPNLLITNLEQSKYLRVTTWERLYDLRKQSGKPVTRIIDRDMGFELCTMDGIEAIVLGTFTRAGDVFATDVKVIDVRTKELLKGANSKGEGVGSILKTQIDDLSRDISRGIGLSERKIESTPMQIAERTTESMDAYNYYLRGIEEYQKFYYGEARKYLEKAVSIDSTFAIAYVWLAFADESLNDPKASLTAYQRAVRYNQKAPERERLMIEAAVAANIEKKGNKAMGLLKEVAEKYPQYKWAYYYLGFGYERRGSTQEAIEQFTAALRLDPTFGLALNQLGYVYAEIGQFDKAIECFQRYADASPGDANPFDSMGELYFKMGRLDDAIAKYKEVLEIRPEFFQTNFALAYMHLLKGEFAKAEAYMERFISGAPSSGLKARGYCNRAIISYYGAGKLRQSLSDLDKARGLFSAVGGDRAAALVDALRGWIQYDRNEIDRSRQSFGTFFAFEAAHNPRNGSEAEHAFALGLLDLRAGRIADARSKLAEMDSVLQTNLADEYNVRTVLCHRDMLRAELLLAQDSTDGAIRAMEKSAIPDLPNLYTEQLFWYNVPYTRDVAARAYVKKGDLGGAIAEYEKLLAFDPGGKDRRVVVPKSRYALAKLYEQRAIPDRAIEQYEKFLAAWKNADPDLGEVKDARSRLLRLKAKAAK